MGAKLLYRDAQGHDASVDLPPEGSFLGRAVDCIVRTDDAMVSRKNCKMSLLGGRWFVEDLGSANGTFVNERKIQKEAMSHGDVIRCGSLQVRFVEVADAQAQGQAPSRPQQNVPVPVSQPSESTGHVPVQKIDQIAAQQAPPPVQAGKPTQAAQAVSEAALGASELVRRKDEEIKKLSDERDDLKKQIEEQAQKLDTVEQEGKKARTDMVNAKSALDKLHRQSKQNEDELQAQQSVNEQLRAEVKQLKEALGQTRAQVEDMRAQGEAKDRQLAAMGDDVRRAKQAADSLSLKLQEVTRAKDEQVRAINEQRGDVEHLREILKERERMLEERRVGLINLESQVKDLRQRADTLEKELGQTRGERDNRRDRQQRSQSQVDELRGEIDRLGSALTNQTQGGEQIVNLSHENSELRQQLIEAQGNIDELHKVAQRATEELVQVEKLKGQVKQLEEERQSYRQKLQEKAEAAARDAATQAAEKLKARFEEERSQLIAERDAALREKHEAQLAPSAPAAPDRSEEVAKLRGELQGLEGKLAEAQARVRELELKSASAQTGPPQAAAGGDQASDQVIAELKSVAASAYDGINDALSELRLSIVMAQNTFEKTERTIADREAAKTVREAIEQTLERAEEAKGHIRSLRSLID